MSKPLRYDQIVATLRKLCLQLPQAYEERAWTGTRWRVRKQTFAHVLEIRERWPPAYAKAAKADGPIVIMTFRSPMVELDVHSFAQAPFFRPGWWSDIAGMVLDGNTDWDEVRALVTDSYRVMAPKKLSALVCR
jgi:predicted DNA-binding protein (MmcQ/YjbR family)